MRILRGLLAVVLLAVLVVGLPSCKSEGEGEKAGKAVDKALKDAGKAAEDATE